MLRVTVICVGKLKEKFYAQAAAEYVKRLGRYCKLELIELPEQRLPDAPAPAEIERALSREAEAIRGKIPPSASVVALCIEGRLHSSEEVARLLGSWQQRGEKCLVFVIGGSYGLHPSVKSGAWVQLSMSPMTFPHHLARVMLLEQIYRGCQINAGTRYHK